jgi:quercetin dioxygenase-like cupin family protein
MPVLKGKDMKEIRLEAPVLKNVIKKTAISPEQGWDGWVMRIFTLGENGFSPRHTHPWPHINYIIEGTGTLFLDGKENSVSAGDTAYIPPGEDHQFRNSGKSNFSFICIVPEEGDK